MAETVLATQAKRDILKHVYAHKEAKSNLRLPRANELLTLLIVSFPPGDAGTVADESSGNSGAVDEFASIPLPLGSGINSTGADTIEGDDQGGLDVDAVEDVGMEAAL